jgi:hypothetical protein
MVIEIPVTYQRHDWECTEWWLVSSPVCPDIEKFVPIILALLNEMKEAGTERPLS